MDLVERRQMFSRYWEGSLVLVAATSTRATPATLFLVLWLSYDVRHTLLFVPG